MTRVLPVVMLLVATLLAYPAQAETPAPSLLEQVVRLVRQNYVAPERVNPQTMFIGAARSIANEIVDVLATVSSDGATLVVRAGESQQSFSLPKDPLAFDAQLELLVSFVQEKRQSPGTRRDLEVAGANGLLAQLDPHSGLIYPARFTLDRGIPLPPCRQRCIC